MKVAAYQAPLAACADPGVIALVRRQVDRCEALGVPLLCCPEGLVGGLADPAINQSVYRAGVEAPVFTAGGVTFGVIICRDSVFGEPARSMVSRGAKLLLVPTNNGMPREKGGPELVEEARAGDVARAVENGVPVVRADVAGSAGDLVSYGSSGIVNRDGRLLGAASVLTADLVVAEIFS